MKVVIGGARKDRIPALVCERSIRRNSSVDVEIIHSWDKDLPSRKCPTGFSYVRFQVPELCGRQGRALYVDSDMLVYGDLRELAEMDMGGKKVLRAPNQTAVMLIDCAASPWKIDEILAARDAGRPHTDFTARLWPLLPEEIGYLDRAWNMCDIWDDAGKLPHYTSIPSQPWRRKGHPLEVMWRVALHDAVSSRVVPEEWLLEDINLGYVIV